ncbi:hypothetical protein [Acidisoma cladoniae]|uniref:hypothetical protein n=1 Tax=Acidisoma cladoniae TaxID=3040935 RepID=UPI00254CEC70|nr:hypothetical protein [Acidisoma sp. PAMC 29798]
MSDTVTVLRCARSKLLCKRIRPGEIVPYDETKTFDAWSYTVAGLDNLQELIENLIDAPRCAIVRGALINGLEAKGIRRLKDACPETGDQPTIADVSRRWLALDLEDVPLPSEISATDITACAKIAIGYLPEDLSGARCIAQATAGHGIKPGIRLRLWFWLDRLTTGAELKVWLKDSPADPAVFRPAQLIYTAAPLFEGMPDPLPARLAVLSGAEEVRVPSAEALAPPARLPFKPLPEVNSLAGSRYALAALKAAAARVTTAPVAQRHPTCMYQTRSLGRLVEAGLLARSDVESVMIEALVQSGKPRTEGERVVAWALANPSRAPLPEGVG